MRLPAFFQQLALLPRKLRLGLAVAIFLLLGLGAYGAYNLQHQADAADWVTHTYEVVSNLQGVFSSVQDAESSQRVFTVSGNETYLQPHDAAVRALPKQIGLVAALVSDNPRQRERLDQLQKDIEARLAVVRTRIDQRRAMGVKALDATVLNGVGVHLMQVVRDDVDAMIGAEKSLLSERRAVLKRARFRSEIIQTLVGLSSLGLLAMVFVGLGEVDGSRQSCGTGDGSQ